MTELTPLRLAEALTLIARPAAGDAAPRVIYVACGFTPLHLATFLNAYLTRARPGRPVKVETGLYGDPAGNLERLPDTSPGPAVVALEWPDFDGRLSLRDSRGVAPDDRDELVRNAARQARRIGDAVESAAEGRVIAVALPTLPIPPFSTVPGWRSGPFDAGLTRVVAELGDRLASLENVRLLNRDRLDLASPLAGRHDARAELRSGIPHTLTHASILAQMLARLIDPPAPKKGIITDLDGTLWAGILGDDGPDGVSWDPEHRSRPHALYQATLDALARSGVLVAIASKNDPAAVAQAFRRADLGLGVERVFPVEANWGPKSASVARILKAWNVGAADVVFVDDSPLERAEVEAAFPALPCLAFPDDDAGVLALIETLRDLCGKAEVREEDALRLASIRAANALEIPASNPDHYDAFLRDAGARLTFDFDPAAADPRALELVNKTNQFHLNGRRIDDSEWAALATEEGRFLVVASYEDRYGRLGKVAVIGGRVDGDVATVDLLALSCRAFSRRVEHQCLRQVFDHWGLSAVVLDFAETPKNGPIRDFLRSITGGPPAGPVRVERPTFDAACPALHHRIQEPLHVA